MEPVDPEEAPDYYKVIKDPMGMSFEYIMDLLNQKSNVIFFDFRSSKN